jgi:hypothetical protein
MAIVRYVLAKLKPGLSPEEYLDRSYTTSIWSELVDP